MAKLERIIEGDFNHIVRTLHEAIIKGSISATYEDGSNYHEDGIDFAYRVYERYSFWGRNRVSLGFTVVGSNNKYHLTVITSGGSQAAFFKINTWGEEAFLNTIRDVINKL